MDEIRFGATSADVMPVVSDTTIAITSFTAVGGGIWETMLEGQAETAYEFRSAADLVFDPGTLVENLTQGDPGDPGTISGTNNSLLITDASDDSELAVIENRTIDGSTAGWEAYSTALPAAAFTATLGAIKVEFRFEADDIDSLAGWYIDDVSVTAPGL